MILALFDEKSFENALLDYFYLIDRGYPEKGTLKLVGDKYKLSSDHRTVLYRGVCSQQKADARRSKLSLKIQSPLIIDGYNVLFTLLNYRLGRLVFISTDSICRDAGSLFGKIKKEKLFRECAAILSETLQEINPGKVVLYLDSPVSFSGQHQIAIQELFTEYSVDHEIHVVHSADGAIKEHHEGTIATSDSALIDASGLPVTDLPRRIIEVNYNAQLISLDQKLSDSLKKRIH